jgi:hypothetical protein
MGTTVLCPSRGRPDAAWALLDSLEKTRRNPQTRLVFVVDEDDPKGTEYDLPRDGHELMILRPKHAGGMVNALNAAAKSVMELWPHERVLGFVGDDHRFRTAGWDVRFEEALIDRPGFVYGNDLFWSTGQIPTQIFMSAEIVRELGWMGLPGCTHLYIDNAWMELGQATGCIRYYSDVIVEHMHPAGGKAEWDEGHLRVNSEEMYNHDAAAFAAWRDSDTFLNDVKKVSNAIAPLKTKTKVA